jgi:Na+-translocating ferredoxin:NAD+ oxidoreductase subunit A
MQYLIIIVGAIFVNNIVFSQFLGICPFLGVSNSLSTATGMAAAVTFVMTLSTLVTYLLKSLILLPLHIGYLETVAFILVIAALVQMVELIMKKTSQALYQALGVYLPLITTNCTILGVALMVFKKNFGLVESVVFAISTAIGFGFAMIIFAGIRERMELYDIPEAMKGAPIALITAGLLSLAFMGFAGIVKT